MPVALFGMAGIEVRELIGWPHMRETDTESLDIPSLSVVVKKFWYSGFVLPDYLC